MERRRKKLSGTYRLGLGQPASLWEKLKYQDVSTLTAIATLLTVLKPNARSALGVRSKPGSARDETQNHSNTANTTFRY